MIFYFLLILFSVLATFFTFKNEVVYKNSKKYKLVLLIAFLLIILLRIVKYGSQMGLNCDEAMGGYNSWCIANYGVDMHLMKLPVYLIAWGSGMNVLYPLISVPVVKLFGLNILSYRFLMVFLSIVSAFVLYNVMMKTVHYPKFNLLFLIVLYLNPWMIMANRWALESNLFPILMIFALSSFLMFSNSNSHNLRMFWLIVFNLCVGLSAYSYSNNWIFLAIFVPLILILLLRNKEISMREFLISIIELLVIVWPLIAFLYVNYIGHHTLKIFGLTIPLMWGSRASSQMIFGNGTPILQAMLNNFLGTINLLANGDGSLWNSLPGIGLMFPGVFILAMLGLVLSIKNIKKYSYLNMFIVVSMISTIPLFLFVIPNANHMNAVLLPIFYFVAVGIYEISNTKFIKKFVVVIITMMLLWFSYGYFVQNASSLANDSCDEITPICLGKIFHKVSQTKKTVYIVDDHLSTLYAIFEFWNPMNPYTFNKLKSNEPEQALTDYSSVGRWHFVQNTDPSMKNMKNTIFVVIANDSSINLNNLPSSAHKVHNYGTYVEYED